MHRGRSNALWAARVTRCGLGLSTRRQNVTKRDLRKGAHALQQLYGFWIFAGERQLKYTVLRCNTGKENNLVDLVSRCAGCHVAWAAVASDAATHTHQCLPSSVTLDSSVLWASPDRPLCIFSSSVLRSSLGVLCDTDVRFSVTCSLRGKSHPLPHAGMIMMSTA